MEILASSARSVLRVARIRDYRGRRLACPRNLERLRQHQIARRTMADGADAIFPRAKRRELRQEFRAAVPTPEQKPDDLVAGGVGQIRIRPREWASAAGACDLPL